MCFSIDSPNITVDSDASGTVKRAPDIEMVQFDTTYIKNPERRTAEKALSSVVVEDVLTPLQCPGPSLLCRNITVLYTTKQKWNKSQNQNSSEDKKKTKAKILSVSRKLILILTLTGPYFL